MADVAMSSTAALHGQAQALLGNPPLNQSDAIASLLSLSFAEGGKAPSNLPDFVAPVKIEQPGPMSVPTAQAVHPPSTSVPLASSLSNGGKHHRRLSSTGKTRRRLSDAKEAANRPSPSLLQSSALSLASLSLSSSPPSSYPGQVSTSLTGASRTLAPAPPKGTHGMPVGQGGIKSNDGSGGSIPVASDDEEKNGAIPIPISSSNGRSGKKRGMDHRCETCSKIYRHPSCLIKHRWEHTPHWREASKFVLSKHQQVQLLEAAAILSHMSPAASGGRSLPDDRSLWPSFLSGGSLPPPELPIPTNRTTSGSHDSTAVHGPGRNESTTGLTAPLPSYNHAHPVSSSVPARSTSTGPRLHNYGVSSGVVTQVRPGLIGVTTSSGGVAVIGERTNTTASATLGDAAAVANTNATQPVPVPNGGRHYHDAFGSLGSTGGNYYRNQRSAAAPESWGSSQGGGGGLVGYPYSNGVVNSNHGTSVISGGGWSLPKSSVRSGGSPGQSLSSQIYRRRSRSRSVSNGASRRTISGSSESPPSDDESVDVDRMMEDGGRDRDVDVVIEEEEDEEDEGGGAITRRKGAFVDDGKTGMHTPRNVYGSRYPSRYQSSAGRLSHGMEDDDNDMDRDEEMDSSRRRKVVAKREDEWDGLEMDMDMD